MATKKATKPVKKVKPTPKAKADITKVNKANTAQKVIIHRNLDYIYPKGVTDPLARKKHRQKIRNHVQRLEREIGKLRGEPRTAKKKELADYVGEFKTTAK